MATSKSISLQLKAAISILILALSILCATSARILDEEVTTPVIAPVPDDTDNVETPVSGVNSGAPGAPGGSGVAGVNSGASGAPGEPGVSGENPGAPGAPGANAAPVAGAAENNDHTFTFFLHDILGGSNPTAVAVTGIVANPAVGGQVPFAKPNGAVLPVSTGGQNNNANSGILNNNNVPFLTGLGGFSSNVVQNSGNGNGIIGGGFGMPAINLAQFPTGTTFQKLMFGTMTVFDDELTEGHELGSGLIGKAQGFYVFSSVDGTSQTMAFNVLFHEGGYGDSLCFFGVHRTAVSESHLAIMGGTGKYVNAKGFAIVKTFPAANQQHETDGMETVLKITVYLTY